MRTTEEIAGELQRKLAASRLDDIVARLGQDRARQIFNLLITIAAEKAKENSNVTESVSTSKRSECSKEGSD